LKDAYASNNGAVRSNDPYIEKAGRSTATVAGAHNKGSGGAGGRVGDRNGEGVVNKSGSGDVHRSTLGGGDGGENLGYKRTGNAVRDHVVFARNVLDLHAILLDAKRPMGNAGTVGVLAEHKPLKAAMISTHDSAVAKDVGAPFDDGFNKPHTFLIPNSIGTFSLVETTRIEGKRNM
jgi:hypothetical protein